MIKKIAGKDVEVIFEDNAFNSQSGRTKSEKLANDPDIKFSTGYVLSPDLSNAQNKTFVKNYVAAQGVEPAHYAAQAYDLIFMIKAAVEAVDGDLNDMYGLRAALAPADYPSARGAYSYEADHMPVEDYYLHEVVDGDDGRWSNKIVATVFEAQQDPYVYMNIM